MADVKFPSGSTAAQFSLLDANKKVESGTGLPVGDAIDQALETVAHENKAAKENGPVPVDAKGSYDNVGNRFVRQEDVVPNDPYYGKKGASRAVAQECATCHICGGAGCTQHVQNFDAIMRGSTNRNPFTNPLLGTDGPTLKMEFTNTPELQKKLGFTATVAPVGATEEERNKAVLPRLVEEGKRPRTSQDLENLQEMWVDHIKEYAYKKIKNPKELEEQVKQGKSMPFGQFISEENADKISHIDASQRPLAASMVKLSTPSDPEVVKTWETFFNAELKDPKQNFKAQLSRRYLFEHIAQAKIHFDESPLVKADGTPGGRGEFFELVRSSTPPGEEIKLVSSAERPLNNDDPKAEKVYYRLRKITDIIADKNTTVLHLTNQVKNHWEDLFLKSEWPQVDGKAQPDLKVPGYETKNPFVYFEKIPGTLRSQFMLENAHLLINAMVQADVCTGVNATEAIRDSFGAVMLKPESDPSALDPSLGLASFDHLDPTHSVATAQSHDRDFIAAFEKQLKALKPGGLSLGDVWDGSPLGKGAQAGGEKNKNAYITVFRHHDNASAHIGALGQTPETMWLLSYGNFEKMFYDLVVNFKHWEKPDFKAASWMTFRGNRINGEDTFGLLLPEEQRLAFRERNTHGWTALTEKGNEMLGEGIPTGIANVDSARPYEDVLSKLRTYLGPTVAGTTILNPDPLGGPRPLTAPSGDPARDEIDRMLAPLAARPTWDAKKKQWISELPGISAAMPDVTWATIKDEQGREHDYTILVDRKYKAHTMAGVLLPKLNAEPERDSLMVVPGHIGAFVNLVLQVPKSGLKELVAAARTSPEQLRKVVLDNGYNLRRDTEAFKAWKNQEEAKRLAVSPIDGGKIDSGKYDIALSAESAKRAEKAAADARKQAAAQAKKAKP